MRALSPPTTRPAGPSEHRAPRGLLRLAKKNGRAKLARQLFWEGAGLCSAPGARAWAHGRRGDGKRLQQANNLTRGEGASALIKAGAKTTLAPTPVLPHKGEGTTDLLLAKNPGATVFAKTLHDVGLTTPPAVAKLTQNEILKRAFL